MGFLKVNISDDFSAELMRKVADAGPKAAHILANQVAKDTEPFVPARTKSLANRTRVVENMVVYPGPYARFLYYGKVMVDPETRSAWARKGVTKELTGKNLDIKQAVHGQAQAHWYEASKAQNLEKWVRVAGKLVERELNK